MRKKKKKERFSPECLFYLNWARDEWIKNGCRRDEWMDTIDDALAHPGEIDRAMSEADDADRKVDELVARTGSPF